VAGENYGTLNILDSGKHLFELFDPFRRFRLGFEMCGDHGYAFARNTRFQKVSEQHHAATATHFAHDLFAEDKLRTLALPFFEFGDAVLFVVIPVVPLINETDDARIAQRKATENGGAVKSECARFVDGKISDHLFLVGTRLTFECFYSEVNRINFDELD